MSPPSLGHKTVKQIWLALHQKSTEVAIFFVDCTVEHEILALISRMN